VCTLSEEEGMLYCTVWTDNAVLLILVENNALQSYIWHTFPSCEECCIQCTVLIPEERPAIPSELFLAKVMLSNVYCFAEERDAPHIYYF
jgi:hypothetical protein